MSGENEIQERCPKCGRFTDVKISEFEPTIGHLHCKICDLSITLDLSDEANSDDEEKNVELCRDCALPLDTKCKCSDDRGDGDFNERGGYSRSYINWVNNG